MSRPISNTFGEKVKKLHLRIGPSEPLHHIPLTSPNPNSDPESALCTPNVFHCRTPPPSQFLWSYFYPNPPRTLTRPILEGFQKQGKIGVFFQFSGLGVGSGFQTSGISFLAPICTPGQKKTDFKSVSWLLRKPPIPPIPPLRTPSTVTLHRREKFFVSKVCFFDWKWVRRCMGVYPESLESISYLLPTYPEYPPFTPLYLP